MNQSEDYRYLKARENEERLIVAHSQDETIRYVHKQLASEYARRAKALDLKKTTQHLIIAAES